MLNLTLTEQTNFYKLENFKCPFGSVPPRVSLKFKLLQDLIKLLTPSSKKEGVGLNDEECE